MAAVNRGIRIAGISCAVPDNAQSVYDVGAEYFEKSFIDKLHKNVGVETLYFTREDQSSGDLAIPAAEALLQSLSWARESIGALIFVSQTPDYIVPPTSCRLQHALGLSEDCFVLDTNYGCPAYAQCLMLVWQMIAAGMCDRILLVTAECHHKYISRKDESTALIFGDGAAVTAIERDDAADAAYFCTKVSGEHAEDLALGNYKKLSNPAAVDPGHVYMDGEMLTKYMFRNIPAFAHGLLKHAGVSIDDIDTFLFHQANAYMIRYLGRKLKVPEAKLPINIGRFGNTSGPSIPLLICDKKQEYFNKPKNEKVMLLNYGAGYIISGAVMPLGGLAGGQIVYVK
ncbi:MAG: ketoacyl-ACP synthase III [Clostridiales Family XIII bacterium]|jgi:3-oxoacyl-[acyl-carrier-protein] synthase-3|nr:ketoacyl-ACP synthase III [Clostridiales Family XIII bacterium]